MAPPNAISANQLSQEVGVSQCTLSRWMREAGSLASMTKHEKGRRTFASRRRPQDWSSKEKLRVVMEASSLKDEDLGEYLREHGLHKAQLDEWREAIEGAAEQVLSSKSERAKKSKE